MRSLAAKASETLDSRCRLVRADGQDLLITRSLEVSGLNDGDSVTAVATQKYNVDSWNRLRLLPMQFYSSDVTWNKMTFVGTSDNVRQELSADVEQIVENYWAFAAIKKGGRVVTWGFGGDSGGNSDNVRQELSADVEQIVAADRSFAAIKRGGRVVVWGGERVNFTRRATT